MKPQRALIVATVLTLLVAIGAVVLATTMSSPTDANSTMPVTSTQEPAAVGGGPAIKLFDEPSQYEDDDQEAADDDDDDGHWRDDDDEHEEDDDDEDEDERDED